MKTVLKVIGIVLAVAAIVFAIIYIATGLSTSKPKTEMTGYIQMGDEQLKVTVVEYTRISSGWIRVKTSDGVTWELNEKNLILEGR